MGFRALLAQRQQDANTLGCVGLDPLVEKMPKRFHDGCTNPIAEKVHWWMWDIVQATAEYASMFKPQIAHWEAIPRGREQLGKLIRRIHSVFPGIPVFLDCKRGDIARTQKQYGVAAFDLLEADGMNFSPYMGRDCMAALVDKEKWPGKALVGLCYTSNPDAREVQDVQLWGNTPVEHYYWEFIAERTLKWAEELDVVKDAGLVMAAAHKRKGSDAIYSEHLKRCRGIVSDKMWFLIPGIGAQGGFIEQTVLRAYRGPGTIAINSSSEIIFASSDHDYAEAAAQKAKELRDAINNAIAA